MSEEEIWKDIPNYEGLYQASTLGRIKSLPKSGSGGHLDSIILKNITIKDGYKGVSLCKNKEEHTYSVHRLIAKTFIDNYSDELEVNHINEDKSDNRLCNLELCTRKYNINYGTRTSKYYKAIIQETLDGKFVAEYKSVEEAAKAVNGKAANISRFLKGGYKSWNGKIYTPKHSYGYIWKYK